MSLEEQPELDESIETTQPSTSEQSSKESEKPTVSTKPNKQMPKQDKNIIYVTMFGIIRGADKCMVCVAANNYFNRADKKPYFQYKHVLATKPAARAIAKKQRINQMPFFKYRTPEDTDWKYITGWNELDWDEMIPHIQRP